ncbi:hypothetical protein DdX_01370 [Ditylenchus destructor]|uniref:Uncharacterized protein n=1 Tax=Ditylenchus destructor TaxID=166010 RepID=A0AAD4NKG0_9BILA|nr:hypothetical protein DdX_01370 [Ditylenchus destructor]
MQFGQSRSDQPSKQNSNISSSGGVLASLKDEPGWAAVYWPTCPFMKSWSVGQKGLSTPRPLINVVLFRCPFDDPLEHRQWRIDI